MTRKLAVTEAPKSGLLGGPHCVQFDFDYENATFEIAVEQYGVRTITILAPGNIATDKLLDVYYNLRIFLLLLDGQFFQIQKAIENDVEITDSLIKRELPCYDSADFMIGTGKLFNNLKVLTSDFLYSLNSIKRDLDISFKVMLYCVSSVKLPVDMKCASLIEAFIPLAELIQNRTTDFILPHIGVGESKLQKYLNAIITRYGQDIFCKEYSENKKTFTQILTDSRNRIAHVKGKQGRIVLNGEESVMYLCKLSLFYRVVLFNMIGIPCDWYKRELNDRINLFDSHQSIICDFIAKWRKVKAKL